LILPIPLGLSNAYLIQGDRALLVDTGRARDVGVLLAAIRRAGVDPSDLALVLHTHAHWDHCGGTRGLKKKTGVRAAVHHAEAERMRRGSNGVLRPTGPIGALLRPVLDRPFPGIEPDLLFGDETDLRPFGVEGRVLHTPGHTAGSVSVLTADREAIAGDLLMGGYVGGKFFPERPTLHYFAEDLALLRASVRKLLEQGVVRVFVGHGGPLSADAIRKRFGQD
jgi:glyoxylase-like metal-dependent hydrolase (beta-lactamase superfamily II)